MDTNCKHCPYTKGQHKLSVWQDSWGTRHDFENKNSVAQVLPMLAKSSESFVEDGWVYERKYDGIRT